MYKLQRLIHWIMILASPARLVAALPIAIPAQTLALQASPNNAPYVMTLATLPFQPIVVHTAPQPNFDTDVLKPLEAIQAQEAAAAAAQVQAQATAVAEAQAAAAAEQVAAATPVAPVAISDAAFTALRYCEAGGDYTRNSGNGYYGAYQYSLSTWANYDGYARPDLAPAPVQDAKAHADAARRGFTPWPACGRKLGLL